MCAWGCLQVFHLGINHAGDPAEATVLRRFLEDALEQVRGQHRPVWRGTSRTQPIPFREDQEGPEALFAPFYARNTSRESVDDISLRY